MSIAGETIISLWMSTLTGNDDERRDKCERIGLTLNVHPVESHRTFKTRSEDLVSSSRQRAGPHETGWVSSRYRIRKTVDKTCAILVAEFLTSPPVSMLSLPPGLELPAPTSSH